MARRAVYQFPIYALTLPRSISTDLWRILDALPVPSQFCGEQKARCGGFSKADSRAATLDAVTNYTLAASHWQHHFFSHNSLVALAFSHTPSITRISTLVGIIFVGLSVHYVPSDTMAHRLSSGKTDFGDYYSTLLIITFCVNGLRRAILRSVICWWETHEDISKRAFHHHEFARRKKVSQ